MVAPLPAQQQALAAIPRPPREMVRELEQLELRFDIVLQTMRWNQSVAVSAYGASVGELELEMAEVEAALEALRTQPVMAVWMARTRRPVKIRNPGGIAGMGGGSGFSG